MKETIEEIAADWLEEACQPFPVLALSEKSFQMIERPDPRGGRLRFLVPMDVNSGIGYFLYRP